MDPEFAEGTPWLDSLCTSHRSESSTVWGSYNKVGPYDRCRWSYGTLRNELKWPYKWVTGLIPAYLLGL